MNRRILRSAIAIPSGWVAGDGIGIVVTVAIGIFYPEPFRPGVQLSVGWCLITLFLWLICNVIGGFVTGVIARRKEIEHALGLVLFTVLVSVYLWSRNDHAVQVPTWYVVAGYALTPAQLLGGWLRKRQLERKSEMMMVAADKTRLVVGALVALVVFFLVLFWGTALTATGVHRIVRRFLGEEYYMQVIPLFVLFLVLASVLARHLFKRIIGIREDLGQSDDGGSTAEEEK